MKPYMGELISKYDVSSLERLCAFVCAIALKKLTRWEIALSFRSVMIKNWRLYVSGSTPSSF